MSDDFSPIRPKQVPLTHATPERSARAAGPTHSAVTWGLGLLLAGALLVAVFYLIPAWLERSAQLPAAAVTAPAGSAQPAPAGPARKPAAEADDTLPPFQQLQRERAREQAQAELAQFVELQIELEDSMQVGAWGAEAYTRAKALAAAGDEAFVREQFEQSVDSYRAATAGLSELIERGRALLESSLEKGTAALAARDAARAREAFDLAATIAPDDPRVQSGQARLARLPEINELMRLARNQELAEQWSAALESYQRVHALDPATGGLEDALARVAEGRKQARVQALLSDGFAHLDENRFDGARKAFREALALDPGNAVAEGALEQVAKRAEVARISTLRQRAEQAESEERWEDAQAAYGEVLAVDPAIQFAQAGQTRARAQQRTSAALARIIQSPDRLSSDQLYQEAGRILTRAERLEPRGPRLASQITDVRAILDTYANPVPVVLRSDNLTQVTVSSVGVLGSFTEKRLELRPGAYTVIGSRDGCRDVREQIVVRPNMNPVDIRCVDTL